VTRSGVQQVLTAAKKLGEKFEEKGKGKSLRHTSMSFGCMGLQPFFSVPATLLTAVASLK
jgi:hypothetical protein